MTQNDFHHRIFAVDPSAKILKVQIFLFKKTPWYVIENQGVCFLGKRRANGYLKVKKLSNIKHFD
jgi:hypothetical protein